MGAVIGSFLSAAVGIAISPMPIIILLLALFTTHARINALATTVGWFVGVFGLGTLVILLGIQPSTGTPSTTSGLINVAFGLLLLALAVQNYRKRPEPGEPVKEPAWMAKIDTIAPPTLLGLTALLIAVNAKNTTMIITGALEISVADVSVGQQLVLLAIFSALACLPAIVITGAYLLFGDRIAPMLVRLRDWLQLNSATVMMLLFAILGTQTLGKGITILTS